MTEHRHPNDLVREFHETYDAPIRTGPPTVDYYRVHLRVALIAEEFAELVDAVYGKAAGDALRRSYQDAAAEDDMTRDVVGAADALADMEYVIEGMALESGIPLPAVVAEVHRANMSKLGEDGRPILRGDGKVLKGPNYAPPDVAAVLGAEPATQDA